MRIVYMGTPDFAVPGLRALAEAGYSIPLTVTQPDRPKGRGGRLAPSPVKQTALALGLEVFQPERVRSAESLDAIRRAEPDLIVVAAYGQILPKTVLDLPPFGCLNVHASLLPALRGAAPIHWAVLNGCAKTGITMMQMDEGMDTGAIWLQREVDIPQEMTSGELHDALAQLGAAILPETLELLFKGELRPVPQDSAQATYAPMLKKAHEWIRWERGAGELRDQIRGLAPWPGASARFEGKTLKINEAAVLRREGAAGAESVDSAAEVGANPGTVLGIVKNGNTKGFSVQTGAGALLVSRVKPEGRQSMDALSFVNGYGLEVGYEFETGE
ncbi:MAG: methionyl-tRNA formyltransferase [Peptococcaceae bacterium]|jgi:methionyl-tRNA formyltransferase|nr:methionyl-tRNA formyltransferase [Peptococcaceae bacterium]